MFSFHALSVAALVVTVAAAFGWLVHQIHVTEHREELQARWIAYARVTRARRAGAARARCRPPLLLAPAMEDL